MSAADDQDAVRFQNAFNIRVDFRHCAAGLHTGGYPMKSTALFFTVQGYRLALHLLGTSNQLLEHLDVSLGTRVVVRRRSCCPVPRISSRLRTLASSSYILPVCLFHLRIIGGVTRNARIIYLFEPPDTNTARRGQLFYRGFQCVPGCRL